MNVTWLQQDCMRLDPYLNWDARQRNGGNPGAPCDTWCLVEIEVPASGVPGSLRVLHGALVGNGRLPGDPAGIAGPTVMASADEVGHLERLKDKTPGDLADPADRRFYLYRREALVYDGAEFAKSRLFRIRHAGPPIAAKAFERSLGGHQPSAFQPPAREIGSEVAIAIIDDGIAFANERFRDRAGGTRIEQIWLQDIGQPAGENRVAVGRVLDKAAINALLAKHAGNERAIYDEVASTGEATPGHKPLMFRRSHGTFCLDVAAGADCETAPDDRPIFAVQLPVDAVADASGSTVGSYVLQGVRQIVEWADRYKPNVPLVINFSYGILAGPKDGSHFLEQALAELVRRRNARGGTTRMVLAAGNSFHARANAFLKPEVGKPATLDWVILPDDRTANYVEIWLDGPAMLDDLSRISVSLTPPDGLPAGELKLNAGRDLVLRHAGGVIAGLNVRQGLGQSGTRTRVFLSVNPTARPHDRDAALAPAGRWRISIEKRTSAALEAHLYIQRDGTPAGYPHRGRQSRFDHATGYARNPLTGNFTWPDEGPLRSTDSLSAIATGQDVIVVGAAATAPTAEGYRAAPYTSSGPTKGRAQPDCSAFADIGPTNSGVLAAGTFSGAVVAMNGTSVAAPQIVRHLADELAAGRDMRGAPPGPTASLRMQPVGPAAERARLGAELLTPNPQAIRNRGRYAT